MPDAAGIEIQDLQKTYDGVRALDIDRLRVESRSTLALIGPSGCGKSTLLRLVVGLLEPERGSILIGGTPMQRTTRLALQRRMGYVIQEGGLFPHLTAGENVALVARDLGWPEARIGTRIGELLELTQIPRALARYVARKMVAVRMQSLQVAPIERPQAKTDCLRLRGSGRIATRYRVPVSVARRLRGRFGTARMAGARVAENKRSAWRTKCLCG